MDHDRKFIIDVTPKEKSAFGSVHLGWDRMSPWERKVRTIGAIATVIVAISVFVQIITHNKYFQYIYWPIVFIILGYIGYDQYKKHYG